MKRGLTRRVVLALLVLAGLTPLPASGEVSRCAGNNIDSYEVAAEPRRDSYRIGQTALIDVRVTDSFTGAPASKVDVGVQIEGRGDRSILAASETNQKGHALVALPLKRSSAEPGWARALAAAWEPINTPVYCTGRYGYRSYPRLFRIRS